MESPSTESVQADSQIFNARSVTVSYGVMAFPIKVRVICSEEFELRPDKPGFANRCPECSASEAEAATKSKSPTDAIDRKIEREANEARRNAMRNLLYRKDS